MKRNKSNNEDLLEKSLFISGSFLLSQRMKNEIFIKHKNITENENILSMHRNEA